MNLSHYHFLQQCIRDASTLASIHATAENAAIWTQVLQNNETLWIGFRDLTVGTNIDFARILTITIIIAFANM